MYYSTWISHLFTYTGYTVLGVPVYVSRFLSYCCKHIQECLPYALNWACHIILTGYAVHIMGHSMPTMWFLKCQAPCQACDKMDIICPQMCTLSIAFLRRRTWMKEMIYLVFGKCHAWTTAF
jgi:hypothetical protein